MSTVIYPSPIFGPVHSRRLGLSLGINLLPADGKVCSFDCIYCECGFNEAHRPNLPMPTRQEVAEALEQSLQQMQAEGRMPDVLTKTEVEVLDEEEWTVARAGVEEAVQHLVDFRIQEGAALEKKFGEKIDNIERLLASIEPYETSRVEKIRARIVDGLKQIPEAEYDKNRLEQELIYYIEKLDISEEKQRLTNHLKYFRETMADKPGQGKKLGFIAQEMGREINTTGSKSNQAEMQNIVVKMKDELEQIKEQVLNAL